MRAHSLMARTLARRAHRGAQQPISQAMASLLIALLVLLIIALLLVAGLLFMRQRRRARKQELMPMYDEKRSSTSSTSSHRRVMIRPSESIYVYQEKQKLMEESNPPSPTGEIPEIRITFPEEYDESGKRQSGRVVVVRVGETSVGLEPMNEKLPAYGQGERFQSLDLDRIGGLVEKARSTPPKI